jgi:hypothetical protein
MELITLEKPPVTQLQKKCPEFFALPYAVWELNPYDVTF